MILNVPCATSSTESFSGAQGAGETLSLSKPWGVPWQLTGKVPNPSSHPSPPIKSKGWEDFDDPPVDRIPTILELVIIDHDFWGHPSLLVPSMRNTLRQIYMGKPRFPKEHYLEVS